MLIETHITSKAKRTLELHLYCITHFFFLCFVDGKFQVPTKYFYQNIGVSIGFIALLLCIAWLYLALKQRRFIRLREKYFQENGGHILQQRLSTQEGSSKITQIFAEAELKNATNNFDENLIIGKGGFGTVYKGFLADNRIVAIKRSKVVDQSQVEQFINEVVVLSHISHRNVVQLLGCCLETEVPLLVYEFINNGTLFDLIHNPNKTIDMSWETRLRIAAETAEALSYLHSAAATPIIHRDVKATNILLDENHTPKVSDFGASRLVPLDQMELATMVQGTLGYLDPEYMLTSQLTEKSDVYSFGVVLVELMTGEKALSFERPEKERSLAAYFLSCLKEDRLFKVIESGLVNEGNQRMLKEMAILAARCLRIKGDERPSMKEVAMELEGMRRRNEKHPWDSIDLDSEEHVHLLQEPNVVSEYGDSSYLNSVHSNLMDHVVNVR